MQPLVCNQLNEYFFIFPLIIVSNKTSEYYGHDKLGEARTNIEFYKIYVKKGCCKDINNNANICYYPVTTYENTRNYCEHKSLN